MMKNLWKPFRIQNQILFMGDVLTDIQLRLYPLHPVQKLIVGLASNKKYSHAAFKFLLYIDTYLCEGMRKQNCLGDLMK